MRSPPRMAPSSVCTSDEPDCRLQRTLCSSTVQGRPHSHTRYFITHTCKKVAVFNRRKVFGQKYPNHSGNTQIIRMMKIHFLRRTHLNTSACCNSSDGRRIKKCSDVCGVGLTRGFHNVTQRLTRVWLLSTLWITQRVRLYVSPISINDLHTVGLTM